MKLKSLISAVIAVGLLAGFGVAKAQKAPPTEIVVNGILNNQAPSIYNLDLANSTIINGSITTAGGTYPTSLTGGNAVWSAKIDNPGVVGMSGLMIYNGQGDYTGRKCNVTWSVDTAGNLTVTPVPTGGTTFDCRLTSLVNGNPARFTVAFTGS